MLLQFLRLQFSRARKNFDGDEAEVTPLLRVQLGGGRKERVMSTLRDVKAAETTLRAAQCALLAYIERPESAPQDSAKHRALAKALKEATDEYVRVVLQLISK